MPVQTTEILRRLLKAAEITTHDAPFHPVSKHGGPGPHKNGSPQSVHGRRGKSTSTGRSVLPTTDPKVDAKIAALADDLHAKAVSDEREISSDLRRITRRTGAGEFQGWDFRVKPRDSIVSKIRRDMAADGVSPSEAAAGIRDLNRYTLTFERGQYVSEVLRFEAGLRDKGYEPFDSKLKNFWGGGDEYDGYNTQWVTPSGKVFEIQFHTPQSFALTKKSHLIYAEVRDLPPDDPAYSNGLAQMLDLWSGDDHRPTEDWSQLGFLVKKSAVAKVAWTFYVKEDAAGDPAFLYRSNRQQFERWDGAAWVPSPFIFDATGVGGSADYSIVDARQAAKLRRTNFTKAADGFSPTVHIVDSDKPQNLVFGWANISFRKDGSQVLDHQGHMIEIADLEAAAYDFTIRFRKSGGMHASDEWGDLVESMVFTPEKLDMLGIPDNTVPLGWWVGFKVPDDEFDRVRDGTWRMFSIEGNARLEEVT